MPQTELKAVIILAIRLGLTTKIKAIITVMLMLFFTASEISWLFFKELGQLYVTL